MANRHRANEKDTPMGMPLSVRTIKLIYYYYNTKQAGVNGTMVDI